MKKKLFVLLAAALMLGQNAWGDVVSLKGVEYNVDTLFHAYIGPGTTQTSLLLQSGTKKLRVFYSQVDLTAPNLEVRAVSARDMMSGSETVSGMAQRKSRPGARYFMGVNGDFWYTGGYTARGQSMVGTPCSTSIAEGVIYRAQTYDGEYQFTLDEDSRPTIGNIVWGGTVVRADGTQAIIHGVNTDAAENRITIYNPTYYTGTNQSGTCSEVAVDFAEGETFRVGEPCRLVVKGAPSTVGDMTLPATGFVLHGRGSTYDFINTLADGDEITLTLTAKFNGSPISPREVISGQPWILRNGNPTYDGNPDVHPRTALGYSEDGNVLTFLVVDGRSMYSDGITTDALGDLMKYVGCHVAVNVDGGGSSALYTSALGVRNRPSDGSERADSNGIFAVCTAPDDDEVASVRFTDWNITLPLHGIYTPTFYGYNQYGMLVESDVQGVTLSCGDDLGEIINDGTTLYATSLGTHNLTATVGENSVTIPVTVVESADNISLRNERIINDTYRDYAVEVEAKILETSMPLNPAALTWECADPSIIDLDSETGVLRGICDGETTVTGTIGNFTGTMTVTVEKPLRHSQPIDPDLDPATWKISQSGGKNGAITPNGEGFIYTYTGASGRAPKITLTRDTTLWSLPDTIRLRLNPGEAPVKNVQLGLRAYGSNMSYITITPEEIIPNEEITIDLPTSSWMDADDVSLYPIRLVSLIFNMNTSTTGQEYEIRVNALETIYAAVPPEVAVFGDVNGDHRVNVTDVNLIVSDILTHTNNHIYDLNSDGTVNVTDVNLCVSAVLAAIE